MCEVPAQESGFTCQAQSDMAGDTAGRLERMLEQQRQFITDASHELCTPVAGLRAQLEEAQLHPEQTDLISLLGSALRDVNRLQEIVADLLLLARLKAGMPAEREPVDLGELVQAQLCAQTYHREVRLRLDPQVIVEAVRPHIARVISSLVDNALRWATSTVRIQVRLDDRSAELIVTDDGEGIVEADRERVFEPFTRLDSARSRDRGGSGLGLAIARDIALYHDGTLRVESSCCGGARFVLRLPLLESRALPEPEPA
ncbi:sensor histidine kinase [Sphaerisporangium corydalis]|uniref:Sensor-like histidine kinase SenX3 n=1 Tax=Sphaerisporangium corydalis TaxID=1441875 RepID=A0ABV9E7J2_9ACTN|nr:ATP-binding protein [Sphaerisporangium corydalis]